MKNFVFIVDGEVAANHSFPDDFFSKTIAILSSNPTVVETNEPITPGYLWDGTNFTPPA
jgi:hypothetical protein